MNVLIACEESQRSCIEFRKRGFNAFSCDILEPSGGHPEWHIHSYVEPIINGHCSFSTMDGTMHNISGEWDLIIAHPPCTYLTVTGNRWYNEERYGEAARKRKLDREDAVKFFMLFVNANCRHIAIENPVCIMSTRYRKPDQIVHPYMFGDPHEKRTCLWLKNLPCLQPQNSVKPMDRVYFNGSTKSMDMLYYSLSNLPKEIRSRERSKTFPGFAKAMADQWGNYIMMEVSK